MRVVGPRGGDDDALPMAETMDLMRRVTGALEAARFAEARRQPDGLRVDGFLVEAGDDGGVNLRWRGHAPADPMATPARGSFLARYADTLGRAGIRAVLVEGPGEPYLHCPPQ
jgi:hypothetical protein